MNQKTAQKLDLRKLVTVSMLCAIAWVLVAVIRIPIIPATPFLKLDFKDVIFAIGGLIFGPVTGLLMALVVALLEMVTVSESGVIGMLMNVLPSAVFVGLASLVYKHWRNIKGAVVGLILGVLAMTAVMLLSNYFITPLYTGWPREDVAVLLLPGFLPFNLLKGTLNAALVLLLYKPLISAMRIAGVVPNQPAEQTKTGNRIMVIAAAALVLVGCVIVILFLQGVI